MLDYMQPSNLGFSLLVRQCLQEFRVYNDCFGAGLVIKWKGEAAVKEYLLFVCVVFFFLSTLCFFHD